MNTYLITFDNGQTLTLMFNNPKIEDVKKQIETEAALGHHQGLSNSNTVVSVEIV